MSKTENSASIKYDAIIMDPPAFGHGANKEIWKIEEHFISLIEDCINLLKELEVSSNPEVGHYFERAWVAVFGVTDNANFV